MSLGGGGVVECVVAEWVSEDAAQLMASQSRGDQLWVLSKVRTRRLCIILTARLYKKTIIRFCGPH